ncbi:MAG: hypothetical protein JW936_07835 [Sedimentisphaerales bacterium]|nr:hypothetical protein [Sedimentisphaerales bacterium]
MSHQADKGHMHMHMPHWHSIMMHLEHLYYDDRFWAVAAVIVLLAVLILLTVLVTPIQNPLSDMDYWRHLPSNPTTLP